MSKSRSKSRSKSSKRASTITAEPVVPEELAPCVYFGMEACTKLALDLEAVLAGQASEVQRAGMAQFVGMLKDAVAIDAMAQVPPAGFYFRN
jgi:DNA-binding transcriptional regulator PaaX